MHYIFCFSFVNVCHILKYILLECPILIFSNDKEKYTNIFETLFYYYFLLNINILIFQFYLIQIHQ